MSSEHTSTTAGGVQTDRQVCDLLTIACWTVAAMQCYTGHHQPLWQLTRAIVTCSIAAVILFPVVSTVHWARIAVVTRQSASQGTISLKTRCSSMLCSCCHCILFLQQCGAADSQGHIIDCNLGYLTGYSLADQRIVNMLT